MRSVLITGCSSGIGRYCSSALSERGWWVFATARRAADVASLRGAGFDALQMDVTDQDSIDAALAAVLERTGGTLDAVFNNAGYGQFGAVEDVPSQALAEQFETNVFGMHRVIRGVLPIMRRQGHGRIVNHSSVLGFAAMTYRGAYNASKFAVEGLTDTLRQELHGNGIGVSLIQTGPVNSRFRDNAHAKYQQWIAPQASAHGEVYTQLERRFNGGGSDTPFTLGPEAVCKKLCRALESRHPKPRYHVTLATHLLKLSRRTLPSRAYDWVLMKSARKERS